MGEESRADRRAGYSKVNDRYNSPNNNTSGTGDSVHGDVLR